MAQIRYGIPAWLARVPRSRRPSYPPARRDHETEVAIVGGGFSGCATAYAFAAAGIPVALLEAAAIGQASTARSTGLLRHELDIDYLELEARSRRSAARRIWRTNRRAALDLGATLRRLRVQCQLETRDAIYFTTDEDDVKRLRRELGARREVGSDTTWLTQERLARTTNLAAFGGVRTRGNSQVDPYRMCLGMAASAAKRGAVIYERSPATKIQPHRKGVDITTERGTVRAQRVIVATGSAGPLFKPLARHLMAMHTYVVLTPPLGAKIRAELGQRDTILWDAAEPAHYLRWTKDGRVIFSGADQPAPPSRRLEKTLVQRTGQLMYELSTLYPVLSGVQPDCAWANPVSTTADGLPYIGPHRNFPRHLFAFGLGHNALTAGFLASRILLRYHQGVETKDDELVGFTR